MRIKLITGDCLEKLKLIPDNFVDSVVTDPPAGISFMGKSWDDDKGGRNHWIKWMEEVFVEVKRTLKPGGHCFVWALPRTSHWTATALEDAGFEIRDIVTHVFGSGFPKSHNISKAIDKQKGLKAKQWEGWGTSLKPASEHWILCRKTLSEKTIADNVLKWGTGGINVDKSRIETSDIYSYPNGPKGNTFSIGKEPDGKRIQPVEINSNGRFPANFIHDGSDEVNEEFDKAGILKTGGQKETKTYGSNTIAVSGLNSLKGVLKAHEPNQGSAARFFYCSKASGREKNEGLDDINGKKCRDNREAFVDNAFQRGETIRKNNHPTIKPIKLMSYLINMITPPDGIVLDPFLGSGSTGVAAVKSGFSFIGIEKEEEYMIIAKKRIEYIKNNLKMD